MTEPVTTDPQQLSQVLQRSTVRLRAAGIPGPERDSRLLVTKLAGLSLETVICDPQQYLPIETITRIEGAVARRAAREPVARILGEREFYGRTFRISPAVLDPRPDSETLIECVLDAIHNREIPTPGTLVDLGTGSGCLALTLLAELPTLKAVGVDLSAEALAVAADNAKRLGVADRFSTVRGDAFGPPERLGAAAMALVPYDIVISNPPYIRTEHIAGLDADVREFDPLLALDGGADGLDCYRGLAQHLADWGPDGLAVLECGADMAQSIVNTLQEKLPCVREYDVKTINDLNGHGRCVAIRTRKC